MARATGGTGQPLPDTTSLYDAFSQDYDRFVNWEERLTFEMPFLLTQLRQQGVRRVLDAACGTGRHAIALVREGYEVVAADLSRAMAMRAKANADREGVKLEVWQAGFGELADHSAQKAGQTFDAIVCLGNSLPHLTSSSALEDGLTDMAVLLRPGGLLIAQQRNFDRVLAQGQRFMPPEEHRSESGEWVFFRFYDLQTTPDGGTALQFNVVRLHRQQDGAWIAQVGRTDLRAWRYREMSRVLAASGYGPVTLYGSLKGEPFDAAESGDLVFVAEREGGAR